MFSFKHQFFNLGKLWTCTSHKNPFKSQMLSKFLISSFFSPNVYILQFFFVFFFIKARQYLQSVIPRSFRELPVFGYCSLVTKTVSILGQWAEWDPQKKKIYWLILFDFICVFYAKKMFNITKLMTNQLLNNEKMCLATILLRF